MALHSPLGGCTAGNSPTLNLPFWHIERVNQTGPQVMSFHDDVVMRDILTVCRMKSHDLQCLREAPCSWNTICLVVKMPVDGEIRRSGGPHLECPKCFAR